MKKPERSEYEKLGILPQAKKREIRKRFKELAREFTPEHHADKFEEINRSYQKITGKILVEYDQYPIYNAPFEFIKNSISDQSEDSSEQLSPLGVIPESIFTVEFEVEKIIL